MHDLCEVAREAIAIVVPYSVVGEFGQKQEREFEQIARVYFDEARAMMERWQAEQIARLALSPELEEARTPQGEKVHRLTRLWSDAAERVRPAFEASLWETTNGAANLVRPMNIRREASIWAESHAADLVEGISNTDANRIGHIVATGIDKEQSVDAIADDILLYVNDDQMTAERSRSIAATETNNALAKGADLAYTAIGAVAKDWFNYEGACEICEENEGAGIVPIRAEFPSGHQHPTAHPWCRCFCQYYMEEDFEDEVRQYQVDLGLVV